MATSSQNEVILIYLLDTNVASAIMQDHPSIYAWISALSAGDEIELCPIVQGEILYGIERLPEGKRRVRLSERARDLFANVRSEAVPPHADEAYSRMKFSLYRRGLLSGRERPVDRRDRHRAQRHPRQPGR